MKCKIVRSIIVINIVKLKAELFQVKSFLNYVTKTNF